MRQFPPMEYFTGANSPPWRYLQHATATAIMEGGGEAARCAIVDNREHPIGIVLADK